MRRTENTGLRGSMPTVVGSGTLYDIIAVAIAAVGSTAVVLLLARRMSRTAEVSNPSATKYSRWWITPALVYVTALTIIPFYYLLGVSFLKWNVGLGPISFIGISNYISAALSPAFQQALLLTLEVGLGFTAFELLLGMGIALLLHTPGRVAGFVTTSFILPLMMTPFLIYMVWSGLTAPLVGWVSYAVKVLTGNPNPLFFEKSPEVFFALLVVDTWQWLPFVVVILIAGLRALPSTPLEAAEVDGAGPWSKFRFVTLPLLRPVIAVVVLFRLVACLQLLDPIQFFTHGGPGGETTVLSYLIYLNGFGAEQRLGLASAQSFLYLLLVMAIAGALMLYIYGGLVRGRQQGGGR